MIRSSFIHGLAIVFLLIVAAATAHAQDAPVALSPEHRSSQPVDQALSFAWQASGSASSYDFLIYDRTIARVSYRNASVPVSICESGTCVFQPPASVQLPVGSNHVWRVAAVSPSGKSDFSYSLLNILSTVPGPARTPVALMPEHRSSQPINQTLSFSWQAVDNASSYDFLIYDRTIASVSYRNPSVPSSICETGTCVFQPPASVVLPVGSNHLWRVAAVNASGKSEFSYSLLNILIADAGPAQTPVALTPEHRSSQPVDQALSFSWQASDNASSYDFLIYDRTIASVTYRNRSVASSICESGTCIFQPPDSVQLPVGSDHFWRVAAVNEYGKSDFSYSLLDITGTDSGPSGSYSILYDDNFSDYELLFADDFSNATLDPEKWDTGLLWGPYLQINNETQLYVDSLGMHSSLGFTPFELTGSTLKITAVPVSSEHPVPPRPAPSSSLWQPRPYSEYRYNAPVGSPGDDNYNRGFQSDEIDYLSGIITSYGSFKMSHGYVEARVKLPAGRGLWPAFWMLPTHYVEDVPEIDVMEFLGQDVDRVYHTYHYFDIANNWQLISTPSYTTLADDWTEAFHTFGMAWSPREIVWYVDGVETRRINDTEYRIPGQAMYLIANLAVGGNWPGNADESTPFPATYEIDYIRAYKKRLSPTLNLAEDYQIMFEDDFTDASLDPAKWNTHFLWGPYQPINNEEQYYVDALGSDAGGASPFFINDGILSITARAADDPAAFPIPQTLPLEDDSLWQDFTTFNRNLQYSPGNYTSGIITSYDAFKFAYGYAEIRARIPSGAGLWPAFWLLNGYYIDQQPEIDIMEVRGENPHQIVHSYHRREAGVQQSTSFLTDGGNLPEGYSDDFHTYGVRWQPGSIEWYIDGELVQSYAGEDVGYQLMYVIANLAVGGDFNEREVDTSLFPTSLDIDYIRVYQEKDT